ncbi:UNVERIFIED_CONTAM: hypothetical protein BEN50_15500 [Euhalothece sp. KZN 001]
MEGNFLVVDGVKFAKPNIFHNTISKKLGYSLSPQPPFERGALVDRCVVPVDRNGISSVFEFFLLYFIARNRTGFGILPRIQSRSRPPFLLLI